MNIKDFFNSKVQVTFHAEVNFLLSHQTSFRGV